MLISCSSDSEENIDDTRLELSILEKIYTNSGGNGNANTITISDFNAIGIDNLLETDLYKYQNAIALKTDFSNPATIE